MNCDGSNCTRIIIRKLNRKIKNPTIKTRPFIRPETSSRIDTKGRIKVIV